MAESGNSSTTASTAATGAPAPDKKAEKSVLGTSKWDKYGSGYPHDLSEDQRTAVNKFLERVSAEEREAMKFSCETNEDFACRALRARKFDVEKALQMVAATKKWRDEFGVEELKTLPREQILQCPEEEVKHFWPQARLPALDKECRPVYIERTGKTDVSGLMKLTTSERLLRWHVACVETDSMVEMERANEDRRARDGRTVNCGTTILDLEGFSVGMFMGESKAYLNKISQINQDYYPETMGKMFVINAPALFTTVWSVVKGWLDARTVSKIEILGGPTSYQPRLFDVIGEDNVPVEYGGKFQSPDGLFPPLMTTTKLASKDTHVQITEVSADKKESYRVRWWADCGGVTHSVRFLPGFTAADAENVKTRAAAGEGELICSPEVVADCDKKVVDVRHTPSSNGVYVSVWLNDNKSGMFSSNSRTVTYRAVSLSEEDAAASNTASGGGAASSSS